MKQLRRIFSTINFFFLTCSSILPTGLNAQKMAAGSHHSFFIFNDTTVRVWGYNTNGRLGDGTTIDCLPAIACVTVTVDLQCGNIYVPTAFSPNNDGQNELECVYGKCIRSFHFVICDRLDNKVFETTDPKTCWDGRYKDRLMNSAVFF